MHGARLLRVCLAALAVALLTPLPALAHLGLRISSPVRDARLESAPTVLTLGFTQDIDLATTRISLFTAAGVSVALGALEREGTSMRDVRVAPSTILAEGSYRIEWLVVGADGHPVRGTIPFHVGGGSAAVPEVVEDHSEHDEMAMPEDDTAAPHTDPLAHRVLRWLHLSTLVLFIGVAVVLLVIIPGLPPEADMEHLIERCRRLGWALSLLFIAIQGARLVTQARLVTDGAMAEGLRSVLVSTWGAGWIFQTVAVLLMPFGLLLLKPAIGAGRFILGIAALAAAATAGLTGHSATASLGIKVVDALHVLGAGGWLGSLAIVASLGFPLAASDGERRDTRIAGLINAFSPVALALAATTMAAGSLLAWQRLGGLDADWSTPYARLILIKLALVFGVATIGFINWRVARPRLGSASGTNALIKLAVSELALGLLVLVVTAVLVGTPPR